MAIRSGKTRVSVTMPDDLLAELQQEAHTAKRTVSEVIVAALDRDRRGMDQRVDALKEQLTHMAGQIETELATVHQVLSKVVASIEAMGPAAVESPPTPEEPPPIATYAEMYREEFARTPAPPPPPPPVVRQPTRRRWRFWRPWVWEWRRW